MKTSIELALMVIAPTAVFLDVYIIKSGNDSLPVLVASVILNLAAVVPVAVIFLSPNLDRQVWRIADRLERERCAREYGQPQRLTEFEWRSQLADEIMMRKGY